MNFAVVAFTAEDDALGIISTNWLNANKDLCKFPNVSSDAKKNKLILAREEPASNWLSCPVRILKEYSTFEAARERLSDAEYTSNLESETENHTKKRKRSKKMVKLPGEVTSDDEDISNSNLKDYQSLKYPSPPNKLMVTHQSRNKSYKPDVAPDCLSSQHQNALPEVEEINYYHNPGIPPVGLFHSQPHTQPDVEIRDSYSINQGHPPHSSQPSTSRNLPKNPGNYASHPVLREIGNYSSNPELEVGQQMLSREEMSNFVSHDINRLTDWQQTSDYTTSSRVTGPTVGMWPREQGFASSDGNNCPQPCGCAREIAYLREVISNIMSDFQKEIRQLHDKLDSLISHAQDMPKAKNAESSEDAAFMVMLPANKENFPRIEERLTESVSFKKRLVKHHLSAGGRDIRSSVTNILRKTLDDEVAEMYSLTGKCVKGGQPKLPFGRTKTFELVLEVCFRSFSSTPQLEAEAREEVSKWLQQAKFRRLRREQRLGTQQAVTENVQQDAVTENVAFS